MSKLVAVLEDFDLGDVVNFIGPNGDRCIGQVVRVYNSRDVYHVLFNGHRYEVDRHSDDMRLEC